MSLVFFKTMAQETTTIGSKLKISKAETFEQTILKVAKSFLGTPYVAATLELPKENLVCNLEALDCYTFVENVLAISNTLYSNKIDEANYQNYVKLLRYRNGKIAGYSSRIHYFTEWAEQAEQNKYLNNVCKEYGSLFPKKVNFMSTHRKLYPAFATDNWVWSQIQKMETSLESKPIYHISRGQFLANQKLVKDGDIIAFTSSVEGLDVNHEGFAIWDNGKLKLLHASLEKKKVIISSETIYEYLVRIGKHAGVMILRPSQKI